MVFFQLINRDIGVNLTDPVFRGVYHGKKAHQDDLGLVLKRATNAGVTHMLITGGNLQESKEAIRLAQEESSTDLGLFATVGCHPTRCTEFEQHPQGPDAYLQELRSLIKSSKYVKAIGECGLDYDRLHFCPKETQQSYFKVQFDLADESGLPMFLHNRNTGDDFVNMVKEHQVKMKGGGVVHSFTGSTDEMLQLAKLGLYIGVNGCSLKTEENLKTVKAIPTELLLFETDSPWCDIRQTHASYAHLNSLSPDLDQLYGRGAGLAKKKEKFVAGNLVKSRNEPCTIGQVAHVVASIRGQDPSSLANIVWENTQRLFKL